jgi:hypothetical protein
VKLLLSAEMENRFSAVEWFPPLKTALTQTLAQVNEFKLSETSVQTLAKIPFFQAPTKTILVNSSNQNLTLYSHPLFGKRMMASLDPAVASIAPQPNAIHLPPLIGLVNFIQGFHGGN